MSTITAVYRVTAPADLIEQNARDIALEQTVEVPESLVVDPFVREQVLGKVLAIEPTDQPEQFQVKIAYNAALACSQLSQLLNLIFGNISIKNNNRLIDLQLPESLLNNFQGPKFGTEGLRQATGIEHRPLLATAIKPRGAGIEHMADIAGRFALGGGDLIKDDHNLVDANLEQFKKRVSACHTRINEANARTGRGCLYFPNLCVPAEQLTDHLDFLIDLGVPGILLPPLILGMDTVRHIAETCPLIIMAHPTFGGTFFHDPAHGMEPAILLGELTRLAGADISVYPNYGGRFGFTKPQCVDTADRLGRPWAKIRSALPAPAGGMRFENIPEMAETYGTDAVFLVGGGLLAHGDDLQQATEQLCRQIESRFPDHRRQPPKAVATITTRRNDKDTAILEYLPCKDYRWQGREKREYKGEKLQAELPFANISRQELIGRFGERTSFDLRYFEISPGGYSSKERHVHTHVIIGVRGHGMLHTDKQDQPIAPMDIAYIPPLQVHQLTCHGDEPFGFYCIVDSERDKPMAP